MLDRNAYGNPIVTPVVLMSGLAHGLLIFLMGISAIMLAGSAFSALAAVTVAPSPTARRRPGRR